MKFDILRLYVQVCKATNTVPTWENLIEFDRQQTSKEIEEA